MSHIEPSPEAQTAIRLWTIAGRLSAHQFHAGRVAVDAARVVKLAQQYRRLNEAGCNAELTPRQETRKESLAKRADDLLKPYGLEMSNPWGLCMYAMPIGADGSSSSSDVATFLA